MIDHGNILAKSYLPEDIPIPLTIVIGSQEVYVAGPGQVPSKDELAKIFYALGDMYVDAEPATDAQIIEPLIGLKES